MKPIPPYMKDLLGSEKFIPAVFLRLDIEGVDLRFTTWGTSLELDSQVYYPRSFSIENLPATTGNVSNTVSISIDDVDRALMASLSNARISNVAGAITYAVLTATYSVASQLVMFDGVLSHWGYSPGAVSLVLADLFVQWARVSLLTAGKSCRYPLFRGPECGYAGIERDCDRSYTTCYNYGNQANFGGFRWLPSMVNKKIEI